jgi:hypothetical protein
MYRTANRDAVVPAEFLGEFFQKALSRYARQFPGPPDRVVVYRSGIGYGMMGRIKREEIPVIETAIGSAALVYCVVERKPPLRFVAGEQPLLPGTFACEKIGTKDVAEFYLLSENPRAGVAIPGRYTIIHHHPAVWSDDQFVQLSQYLTCAFPTWAASVSLPSPLLLATKLVELSKHLGEAEPNECLDDLLHFI